MFSHDVGVGDDPRGAVAADAEDPRVRRPGLGGREGGPASVGLMPGPPRGADVPGADRGRPGRRPRPATRPRVRRAARATCCWSRRVTTTPDRLARLELVGRVRPAERPLGRGHQQPPGGGVADGVGAAVPAYEVAGRLEVVGRLERDGLDTGDAPLGQAGERAGRRQLEQRRSRRGRPSHACTRSQRTGVATWSTRRASTARPSCTTAPSRLDSRRVRGSWVLTAAASARSRPTAGAMCTVWNAPATSSGRSRAPSGGSAASAASCSSVPAATIWPAPLSFAAMRPCSASLARTTSAVAAQDRGHPGGGRGCGLGHRLRRARGPGPCACSAEMTCGGRCGGQLADAVAGTDPDQPERVRRAREELEEGDEAGRDDQRLGDGGVADRRPRRPRCRSRARSMPAHGRQPGEPRLTPGQLEPGGEETGDLGALTGRDDGEHRPTVAYDGCAERGIDADDVIRP